jgi:hypothetical protein
MKWVRENRMKIVACVAECMGEECLVDTPMADVSKMESEPR